MQPPSDAIDYGKLLKLDEIIVKHLKELASFHSKQSKADQAVIDAVLRDAFGARWNVQQYRVVVSGSHPGSTYTKQCMALEPAGRPSKADLQAMKSTAAMFQIKWRSTNLDIAKLILKE